MAIVTIYSTSKVLLTGYAYGLKGSRFTVSIEQMPRNKPTTDDYYTLVYKDLAVRNDEFHLLTSKGIETHTDKRYGMNRLTQKKNFERARGIFKHFLECHTVAECVHVFGLSKSTIQKSIYMVAHRILIDVHPEHIPYRDLRLWSREKETPEVAWWAFTLDDIRHPEHKMFWQRYAQLVPSKQFINKKKEAS